MMHVGKDSIDADPINKNVYKALLSVARTESFLGFPGSKGLPA